MVDGFCLTTGHLFPMTFDQKAAAMLVLHSRFGGSVAGFCREEG